MIHEIITPVYQLFMQVGILSTDCEIIQNNGSSKIYSSLTFCLMEKYFMFTGKIVLVILINLNIYTDNLYRESLQEYMRVCHRCFYCYR